jgi:hypothetical protein
MFSFCFCFQSSANNTAQERNPAESLDQNGKAGKTQAATACYARVSTPTTPP